MLELSLKPQNSTSWLYTTTASYTNFIADGTLFGSVAAYTNLNYTGGTEIAIDEAMIIAPPIGNWQGYYQTGGVFASLKPQLDGQVKYPVVPAIEGYVGIKLCSSANPIFGGNSGLYQRVYGLSVGNSYTVTATINSPVSIDADAEFEIGDKLTDQFETFSPISGTSDYVVTFEAHDNYADVYINLYGNASECFIIKEVKCTEHYSETDLTFSDFQDGSVVVDLYEDSIPLTLSVSSFTDATSNLQSYSKDFLLPGTKRNDKIFSHIYDLNTTIQDSYNSFNPYIQTIATLKEDGVEIFSGELTLSSVIKNSEGISYDVHLESRISGLAKVLSGRILEDINLAELDHNYTKTNVVNSWTAGIELVNNLSTDSRAYKGSLTSTDVLKYPAVDWTGDIQDPNQDGNLVLSKLEELFRPFINIKYLFERIIDAAGFTFESKFMQSDTFTKLFMDFNHGKSDGASVGAASFGGGKFQVKYNGGGRWLTGSFTRFVFDNNNVTGNGLYPIAGQTYWDTSDNSFKPVVDGTSFHLYGAIPCYNDTNTNKGVSWRTIHEKLDGTREIIHAEDKTIAGSPLADPHESYTPNLNVTLNLGDSLYFEGKTSTTDSEKVRQQDISNSNDFFDTYMYFKDISSVDSNGNTLLKESRGDVSQWDFIKSLMNMFNLVVSPDNERANHLIIETYDSVFGLTSDGDVLNHPKYGMVGNYVPVNSANTTIVHNFGRMAVVVDGGGSDSHGCIGYPHRYVHGETYTVKFDVHSAGGRYRVSMYDGDTAGNPSSETLETNGEHSFSFVFDQFNSNDNELLKIRVKLTQAGSLAYNVVFNSISVEGKVFNTIIKKDWSDKVDMDSFDMKMMDLSEAVEFSCVKDENDYAAQIYSDAVREAGGDSYNYGDLTYKDSRYTNLNGIDEVKNLVFASTITKPIGTSALITPSVYQGEEDGNFKTYKSKPRILYDNGVKTTSSSFTSPTPSQNDGLTGFTNQNDYLLFTPFSQFDLNTGVPSSAKNLNWGACKDIVTNKSVNNLFNEYWASYNDELYHSDTRMYTVECLLNHNDISNFKFNDIIVIENSEFRVDSINYNSEGLSKVELIKLT